MSQTSHNNQQSNNNSEGAQNSPSTITAKEMETTNQQSINERIKQEPGKPQPLITREEFAVIKSVFERIGCASLITYSDYFDRYIGTSYNDFFANQAEAVQVLEQVAANNKESANGLRIFIRSLGQVSSLLYTIVESYNIFDEAGRMCDALDEAFFEYCVRKIN